MAATDLHSRVAPSDPIHALLSAFPVPLFLGAFLSDVGYVRSYQVQWINFSSWLIAGGLVFAGVAILWAGMAMVRPRGGRPLMYFLLLLATWILGFINALTHAKDAAATMPTGLILSTAVALLALVVNGIGYTSTFNGGAK